MVNLPVSFKLPFASEILMGTNVKEAGLLLLGTSAFIIAVVVAHWYFFKVIPSVNSMPAVNSWCHAEGGKAFVDVRARETVERVKIYVGENTCEYPLMRGGMGKVCVADLNETTVYRIEYRWKGREYSESGVCRLVEQRLTVPD